MTPVVTQSISGGKHYGRRYRTFAEISQIIENTRENACRKVNEELILMYQKVGNSFRKSRRRPSMVIGILMPLRRMFRISFPISRALIDVVYTA